MTESARGNKRRTVPHLATQILSTLCGPLPMQLPGNDYNSEPEASALALKHSVEAWLESSETLQAMAHSVRHGIIPDLVEMASAFPNGPNTVSSQQQVNHFHYFLDQAGALGRLRAEQLRLALGLRQRKYQLQQLQADLQAPHHKAQPYIHQQHQSLLQLIETIESTLINRLGDDPCVGKQIFLNLEKQAYPKWVQKLLRGFNAIRKMRLQAASAHG